MNLLQKTYKNTILYNIIGVLLVTASLSGCQNPVSDPPVVAVKVTGVTLNKAVTSIVAGKTERLIATVTPSNAANKAVSWSTSDSCVTVSVTGLVSAVSPGNAIITVTTLDGSFRASCEVTVSDPAIAVTGINLNTKTTTIIVGLSEQLAATVAPENATNKTVVWSGGSANVSVSASGLVTALAVGSATITATTADGSFTDSCAVTVTSVSVTGVTLNKTATSISIGLSEQLAATVVPENATNKTVVWSGGSAKVSVSASGLVTALAVGSATITATTADGSFTDSCIVTVTSVPVTGVTLNKTATSIGVGLTEQLAATVAPANATNKTVVWSGTNANASVSTSGLVTAKALGSATFTATTADGFFTGKCVVTVIPVPVTGVTLNKTVMALAAGTSEVLTATVNPSNAANKAVLWSSSNNDIAAVSEGQVMALKAGEAKITVTTSEGVFKASCTVTVTGSLSHTYSDVYPAATALQNGINASVGSDDPTSSAYTTLIMTPTIVMSCHLRNYVNLGYTLNGIVAVNINPAPTYTQGAMNGTVLFTGGIVKEISYTNAVFTSPKSGSLGIRFIDGTSGTMNLATGIFTQN